MNGLYEFLFCLKMQFVLVNELEYVFVMCLQLECSACLCAYFDFIQ